MMALDSHMPGTARHLGSADRPPWIRFVVLIPCSQIGPDQEPAKLWQDFVSLLKDQPVTSLINGLTRPVLGVQWTRLATESAGSIRAIYTPGDEREALAAARLELPDGTRRYFHDFASAVLTLHFEPQTGSGTAPLPAGPVAWTDHIKRALELPQTLNRLLTSRLDALHVGRAAGRTRLQARRAKRSDRSDRHHRPERTTRRSAQTSGHWLFYCRPRGRSAG